jgi:hypothetical protein
MKKKSLVIFASALSIIFLFAISAYGEEPEKPLSLLFRFGCFAPDEDAWQDIYGDNRNFIGGIDANWQPHRTVSVGLGLSYMEDDGEASSETVAKTDSYFQFFPVELNVIYHFYYLENQWMVPYVGGGLNYSLMREMIGDREETEWQRGYQILGGIKFPLDFLNRKAAGNLDLSYGVRRTFLTVEARQYNLDNFGSGSMDFSGLAYYTGLFFEFR